MPYGSLKPLNNPAYSGQSWMDFACRVAAKLPIWAPLILVCLPAFPLLLRRPFYVDWVNHVWIIEYFKKTLLTSFSFPTVIDTVELAGNTAPVFYGVLFYPLLSLLAVPFGSDLALRLFCFALLLGTTTVYYLFARSLLPRSTALCCAALLTSSVYQLTNLYTRGAVTEFVAHEFALISFPLLAMGLTAPPRIRVPAISLGFAALCGAVGTHPITAFLLVVFVGPIITIGVLLTIRSARAISLLAYGICAVLALLISIPWLIYVSRFGDDLMIRSYNSGLCYFPPSIDSTLSRLLPWNLDNRVLVAGVTGTITPFLTAPLNLVALPAVIIAVTMFVTRQRWAWLLVFTSAAAIGVTVLALIPSATDPSVAMICANEARTSFKHALVDFLAPIQFAYRIVNTFSLQLAAIFVISIAGAKMAQKDEPRRQPGPLLRALLLGSTVVAMAAISVKTLEVSAEFSLYPIMGSSAYRRQIENSASYPSTYYASKDYSMRGVLQPASDVLEHLEKQAIIFSPQWRKDGSVAVRCGGACLLKTNVLPTSLLAFYDNGARLSGDRLYEDDGKVVLRLDPGTHALRISHDGAIADLSRVFRVVWILWFLGSVAWFVIAWTRRPNREA